MSTSKAVKALKPGKRKVGRRDKKVVVKVLTDEQAAADPRAHARSTLSPTLRATNTIYRWRQTWKGNTPEDPAQKARDLIGLAEELADYNRSVQSGDMKRAEATLNSQAHTLDAIFNELAHRAAANVGANPETVERYLKLALRAQSQCRTTLETLSVIKNPPSIAFIRQANVANGAQQVNNGVPPPDATNPRAHAGKNDSPLNKLLEHSNDERMDARTTATAVGGNQPMEALAQVDRASKSGGKVDRES